MMQVRLRMVKSFLTYRRNSYRFPRNPIILFALTIKLLIYEYKRTLFNPNTSDYVKNHLSALIKLEGLMNEYLTAIDIDFLDSEGWTLGRKTVDSYIGRYMTASVVEKDCCAYLYGCAMLNEIHSD